jgi:hypothetical protein
MTSITQTPHFAARMEDNDTELQAAEPATSRRWHSAALRWAAQDSPYIIMLLLGFVGVILRLPVSFWVVLTPVFGVICTIAGWHQFETNRERVQMAITQGLNWFALIFAIYVLFNNVVKGEMNSNATSLAMMTLLALGTFTAGLQARVWRICAVGGILFVAVPSMGWLDQSAVLLSAAALVVLGIGALTWWLEQRQSRRSAAPG